MFQVHPLPASDFQPLFELSDNELAEKNIQVHVSDGSFPCRVTLDEVEEGERVLLLNYEHQPAESPYRSRHAIFVKKNAAEKRPAPGELPVSITSRLLSVRGFNAKGEIVEADVVEGVDAYGMIEAFFENAAVDYIHLHFARRGCYAAKVTR